MKRRLIVVSASSRVVGPIGEAIPAIDRYDGVLMRTIRKCIREGYVDPRDVLIVSPSLGLVRGSDSVPYHEPVEGSWHSPKLDAVGLGRMNHVALLLLKEIAESQEYSEVYINVGKGLYPIIAGIEKLPPWKIVYASGKGLGPKTAHMRDWMLSKTTIHSS